MLLSHIFHRRMEIISLHFHSGSRTFIMTTQQHLDMANGFNLGDLPSWLTVLLIGFGVVWAASNGMLDANYEGLGQLLIYAALALGAFYFLSDILNKI